MKNLLHFHIIFVSILFSACCSFGFIVENFETYQDSADLNASAPLYLPDNFGHGRAIATLETTNPFDGGKCARFYRSGYPNYTQFGLRFTGNGLDMRGYSLLRLRFRGNSAHASGYNLEFQVLDRYASVITDKLYIPEGALATDWQTIEVPITENIRWANVGYLVFTDRKDNYGITDIYLDGVELVQKGIYVEASDDLVIYEQGQTTCTYQLIITDEPVDDVIITLTAPAGVLVSTGSGFVSQAEVVFNSSNWTSPAEVTVQAIDDNVPGYDKIIEITHAIQSADSDFAGMDINPVSILRVDNDYPVALEPVKVVLLAGQSNMQGAGYNSELQSPYDSVNEKVSIYFDGKWQYLSPGMGASATRFGPELSFGREFADTMIRDNIALIKFAVGGTNLDYFWRAPDEQGENAGPLYIQFTEIITEALGYCNDYEIIGMLWQQGESDANTEARAIAYEQNLRNFIASIRDFTDEPKLPFMIGQVSDSEIWEYGNIVRAAQQAVADTTQNTSLISSAGLPILADQMHYGTEGTLELGNRFASSLLDIIFHQPKWNETATTYGVISPGKFYKYSAVPDAAYPDIYPCLDYSDGSMLTDEVIEEWVGWNQSVDIVLDLGKVYEINVAKLNAKSQTSSSVYYPASMQVYIRQDDGDPWQAFGDAVVPPSDSTEQSQAWLTSTASTTAARYVKYSLAIGSGDLLVSEIEVYGYIVNEIKHAPDVGFYNGAFPVTYQGWLHIDRHETITEQRLSMVLWYHELNPAHNGSGFESIASLWNHNTGLGRNQANHRYLTIGWLPKDSTAAEIATGGGGYDEHFQEWFGKSIDYSLRGGNTDPIWLRPMNEMNGTWSFPGNTAHPRSQWGGDPIGFRRAWRRIYNIAEQVGAADKHIFLWAPNGITYPAAEWNMPDKYYPGDNYVDWVGLSMYVQGAEGKKYPNNILTGDSGAGSFDFGANWDYKPLMIAEGCWRATSQDTDGVRWINEWFDMAHNFPRMKAAVWFHFQQDPSDPDNTGTSDMTLYPEEVLNTFKQRVAERYSIKDPFGGWLDHNRDGFVNSADLFTLAANWLSDVSGVQCFLPTGGLFVAEAENADMLADGIGDFAGDWVAVELGSAIGGWYMLAQSSNTDIVGESDVDDSPKMSFNLWFDSPGVYYVHVRAGGSDTNPTALWFGISGEQIQSYGFTPFSTTALRWYNTAKSITVDKGGLYSFEVAMGRSGVKLDRILLTDNPALSLPSEPAQSNQVQVPINAGDINEDLVIDFEDFAIMANYFEY